MSKVQPRSSVCRLVKSLHIVHWQKWTAKIACAASSKTWILVNSMLELPTEYSTVAVRATARFPFWCSPALSSLL